MDERSEPASGLRGWLQRAGPVPFSAFAVGAAFLTYFSMYGVRRPYAVAAFDGRSSFGDVDLKIALVVSQTIGYALSKYAGIKICSEMRPGMRAVALVALVSVAELALLGFAVLPDEWKLAAMFVNGLPLGMVWGLVFSFLEGRRTSDLLGAGLSTSYIVASGAVKSVGQGYLGQGVSEDWMPAVTGLTFLPLLSLGAWLLSRLPQPSAQDIAARTERGVMGRAERWRFLRENLAGMFPLCLLYVFLTAYRDFRDNFAKEIWGEMGMGTDAVVYAAPEAVIAFLVLGALAALYLVKRNRAAVIAIYSLMTGGAFLIGASTFAWSAGWVSGPVFMTLVGLGLYLAYVPFGCVLFDRLIALLRTPATAVFAIYLTDALGYTGAVGVLLYKEALVDDGLPWLEFFKWFSYGTSALCTVCFIASLVAFLRKARE